MQYERLIIMPIAKDRIRKEYKYDNVIEWQERTTKLVLENLVNYRNQMTISPTHARSYDSKDDKQLAAHLRKSLIQHLQDGLVSYSGSGREFDPNIAREIATSYADKMCLVGMGFDGKQQEFRYSNIKQLWDDYDTIRGVDKRDPETHMNPGSWPVYSYYMDTQDFGKQAYTIGNDSISEFRLHNESSAEYDPGYWTNNKYYSKEVLDYMRDTREVADATNTHIDEYLDEATDNRRLYGAKRSTQRERNGEVVDLDPATIALIRVTFTRNEKGNLVVDAVDIPFAASADLKMNLETIVRSNLESQTGVRMDKLDINQVLPQEQLSEKIAQAELVDDEYNDYMDAYDALIDSGSQDDFNNLINKVAQRTDHDAPDMRNKVSKEIADVFSEASYYHDHDKKEVKSVDDSNSRNFFDAMKDKIQARGLTSTKTKDELKARHQKIKDMKKEQEKDEVTY